MITINKTNRLYFILSVLFLGSLLRFIPHEPNFVPFGAMALFGGAYLSNKKLAFIAPLLAIFFSDILLQIFFGYGFHAGMPFVYGSYAIIVLIGIALRNRVITKNVFIASISASVLFFVVTNFGTWLQGFYGYTLEGLSACYIAAIPFFRGTLTGDLVYNLIFFGGFAIAQAKLPSLVKE
ncbi:MAG TPA: hypothetical protein PKH65_09200 [Bacteroidia bacterium]|nr:hypothetical protein [Bacteroidia bacterium]